MKRITTADPKERMILRLVEEGVAVYSPHTSLDAKCGGVNDWLAEAVGPGKVEVIQPRSQVDSQRAHKVVVTLPRDTTSKVREALGAVGLTGVDLSSTSSPIDRLELSCSPANLSTIMSTIESADPSGKSSVDVFSVSGVPLKGVGMGRKVTLSSAVPLSQLLNRVKTHLGIPHLRVALGDGKTVDSLVQTVAMAAGAGGDLLRSADVWLTGEMRHHEVLSATAKGISVLLTEHSNSERGFLIRLADQLRDFFSASSLTFVVSKTDADPLQIM